MQGQRRISLAPEIPFNLVINEANSVILDRDATRGWNFVVADGAQVYRIQDNGRDLGSPVSLAQVSAEGTDVILVVPGQQGATPIDWEMVPTGDGQFRLQSVADRGCYLVGTATSSGPVVASPPGPMRVRVMRIPNINNITGRIQAKWNIFRDPQNDNLRRVSLRPRSHFNMVINERSVILNCDATQDWIFEDAGGTGRAREYRIRKNGEDLYLAASFTSGDGGRLIQGRVILVPAGEGASQRWRTVYFDPFTPDECLLQNMAGDDVYLAGNDTMEIPPGKMSIRVINMPGIMNTKKPLHVIWTILPAPQNDDLRRVSLRPPRSNFNLVTSGDGVMLDCTNTQSWRLEEVDGVHGVFRIQESGAENEENRNLAVDFSYIFQQNTIGGDMLEVPVASSNVNLVSPTVINAEIEPTTEEKAQRWRTVQTNPPTPDTFLLESMAFPGEYLACVESTRLAFAQMHIQVMRIPNIDHNPSRARAQWRISIDPQNDGLRNVSLQLNSQFNMVVNEPNVVLNCDTTQGWRFEEVGQHNGVQVYRIGKNGEDLNLAVNIDPTGGGHLGNQPVVRPGVRLVPAGGEVAQRWKIVPFEDQFRIQSMVPPHPYLAGHEISPDPSPPSGQMSVEVKEISGFEYNPRRVRAKWNIFKDPLNDGIRHVSFVPRPLNMGSYMVNGDESGVNIRRDTEQEWIFEQVDGVNRPQVYRIKPIQSTKVVTLVPVTGNQPAGVGSMIVLTQKTAGVEGQCWKMVPFEGKFLLQSEAFPTLYLASAFMSYLSEAAGDRMELEAMAIQGMDDPHLVRAKWDIR